MIELMIDLQGGAKAPLYEKICEYIKNEIVDGKISKGEKLPSTRLLAEQLSVSRSTVEMAYNQLLAEGYVVSEACRGHFVCDIRELYQLEQREMLVQKKVEVKAEEKKYIDFSPYAIDTKHFPYSIWRKLHRNVLLDDNEEMLYSGDGQGDVGLRSVIADYLHRARGVNCSPSQIIIGAGNEYLEILLTQLLGSGRKVLMEEPTYLQPYHTFLNMGYDVKTVAIDEKGISVKQVREVQPDIIYTMPSHQFPLGSVMPLKTRLELLQWAAEAEGRYLIEDDHDSEYRYRGKPIPSLQSIDRSERVIYLGTFSKSVAPSLRISYMVLPEHLIEVYRERCGFYSTTVPKVEQEVLKGFIQEGHFGRHLNKMRGIYKAKHDFLMNELKKRSWVHEINGEHAGLHILVQVKTGFTEEELCMRAREAGVKVSGISQHYIHKDIMDKYPILLIGYGKLNEDEIKKGLLILDEIIQKEAVRE